MNKSKCVATSIVVLLVQLALLSNGFRIKPRIINGIVADESVFPFYVNLLAKGTDKFCGGVLISMGLCS